ncbi:hypothetical protein H8959_021272 [Pygathrix nigripes]
MVKKRKPSSDTMFQFETPGSPRKANVEAPRSSTDSPSSVFLSCLRIQAMLHLARFPWYTVKGCL